ncbi:MAG TPA: ribonuclease III [Thermotogota bacterium]|nr:ribonuclease III [Thermotogota bacterium]HRW91754.1 ribonuclease III [Thermotogota bacterium]
MPHPEHLEELFAFSRIVADTREVPVDILAYLGDAFYNLFFSFDSIQDGRSSVLQAHLRGRQMKRALGQRMLFEQKKEQLQPHELDLVRRGMNSRGAKKRGNDPDYRVSTGFEALLGFHFLKQNWDRLHFLLERAQPDE